MLWNCLSDGITGYRPAYGVFTCGESAGGTEAALAQSLSQRGIALHYTASGHARQLHHLVPPAAAGAAGKSSARRTGRLSIAAAVSARERGPLRQKPEMPAFPWDVSTAAGRSAPATEKCTACGLCRAICPTGCIRQSGVAPGGGQCAITCLHRCPHHPVGKGHRGEKAVRPRRCGSTIPE